MLTNEMLGNLRQSGNEAGSASYDYPVDMVYAWCDGNDEKFRSLRNYWIEKLGIKNNETNFGCQWDNHDELKYSIRSVEKYAPWVRNIYIVTASQIPSWLVNFNRENSPGYMPEKPTIKIVNHSDILPRDALPTFNSMAIETGLPFIDGLSEHFLYANDDMFFNDYADKSFFYNAEGKPIVRLKSKISSGALKRSIHVRRVKAAQEKVMEKYKKIVDYLPHHCIDAYTKTAFLDCISDFRDDFTKTAFQKFRSEESVQRSIVLYRAIATNQAVLKLIKGLLVTTDSLFIASDATEKLKKLNSERVKLFCINEDYRATGSDRVAIDNFLNQKYPDKSIYEITK